MRTFGLIVALAIVGPSAAFSQKSSGNRAGESPAPKSEPQARAASEGPLGDDDRLSLIAAALDSRVREAEPDCSHLVHAIYEQAGLSYSYAPSSELYAGIDAFKRVKKPEPGDLVVWRGHVGIVIKPSQHLFFSVLTSGPGIDDYTTRYWKHRGKARFYRYSRSVLVPQRPSAKLVRTKRVHDANPETDDQ